MTMDIRKFGFKTYIAFCSLVTAFCMTMIVVERIYPDPSTGNNNSFYTSTVSFILGKFTILVFNEYLKSNQKKSAGPPASSPATVEESAEPSTTILLAGEGVETNASETNV